MPDKPNSAAPDTAELAAADSAAEQLRRTGNDTTLSGIDPARESALDDAFNSVSAQNPGAEELGKENGGVPRPVPGAPDPEEASGEAAPAKPDPKPEPKTDPKSETPPAKTERKGLLDDVLDEPAPEKKEDPMKAYDDVKLRSDASQKTQDTFNEVKRRAVERETAVRTELDAAKVRLTELESKLTEAEKKSGAIPEEVAKELKEHREYRALHDVSSRPEFKEKFDSKIEANYNAIYGIFKQEGWTDDKVKALHAMPESQRVEFIEKKILPLLTDGQRRVVEAKIYDTVNVSEAKSKALDAARTDAEKILAEQRELPAKERQQKDTAFANVLRPKLQKLAFVYQKEIPSTATPAQKAEIEAHNKLALEYQADVSRAITDESPEIRAEVILAVPLARYLKKENVALKARAEAAEAKLAAITKAGSTGRLGKSLATAADAVPAKPNPAADSGDNIDQLFAAATARP